MDVKSLFFGLLATVGLAGSASAAYVPATWTDTYDVGTGIYIGSGQSYGYFHDLSFDGFEVGSDYVTDFLLSINLFDDKKVNGFWDLLEFEIGFVDLPGAGGDSFIFDFGTDAYQGASILGRAELNAFGTLSITIGSLFGDFYFSGSELVATGYSKTAQVPEPGTLGMFGLGLLGISLAARRRRRG